MSEIVQEKSKVSPFLAFYLIHKMQVGIGVLSFQRIIALEAGYDAWMSVIVAGFLIHPFMWMVYKMAGIAGGDLVSIHQYALGKKMGKWISLPFIVYFALLNVITLRSFIEIVQVWMFQDLGTFWFALAYMVLAVYIIYGGFRTVTGIVFFGTILPYYLFLIFFFIIPYADYANLLPVYDHTLPQLAKAAYNMSLTYIGWEMLLIYYPYLKEPEKSQKWAHLGVLFTTVTYTFITLLAFIFFSEGQLQRTIWASLSMFKIVQMPFVERFEYIGIASWSLLILPNICLGLWGATRVLKRTFNVKQKYGVLAIAAVSLAAVTLLGGREQIQFLNTLTGRIGFFLNYGYIPLLFIVVLITRKVKGHGKSKTGPGGDKTASD